MVLFAVALAGKPCPRCLRFAALFVAIAVLISAAGLTIAGRLGLLASAIPPFALRFFLIRGAMVFVLEEEVPTELKVLLTLTGTLTSLLKHTTEDTAPGCLSRRHIVKMIYFKF
jgi:hypothetical protein